MPGTHLGRGPSWSVPSPSGQQATRCDDTPARRGVVPVPVPLESLHNPRRSDTQNRSVGAYIQNLQRPWPAVPPRKAASTCLTTKVRRRKRKKRQSEPAASVASVAGTSRNLCPPELPISPSPVGKRSGVSRLVPQKPW